MKSVATLVLEVLLFFFFIHTFSVTRDLLMSQSPYACSAWGWTRRKLVVRNSGDPQVPHGGRVLKFFGHFVFPSQAQ